jgi:anaphase-promoting complex subunit 4
MDLLAEKTVHQLVHPDLLAYCPTMDLIALVTKEEQVFVYRLNGQRILGAGQKGAAIQVEKVRWKPTGE